MHKKKISALVVAGLLTVGVIGGTLAWFTSSDEVTNIFSTGMTNSTDPNAGIDIEENFPNSTPDENGDNVYNKPVLPGDQMVKEVKVNSTANYNQFVRAKVTKVWKLAVAQEGSENGPALEKGATVTHYKVVKDEKTNTEKVVYASLEMGGNGNGWKVLDENKIKLYLDIENADTGYKGTWTKDGEYYYYNKMLGEKQSTTNLLEKVTFESDANDNYYKNLTFEVKVEAEGVQATNGAAQDSAWSTKVPAAKVDGYME